MTRHSVNNNTRMSLVISFCANSDHLISLIPAKLPQILDIYCGTIVNHIAGFHSTKSSLKYNYTLHEIALVLPYKQREIIL